MIGLGLFALAFVLFLWLVFRVAQAMNKKLLFWLVWMFGGLGFLLAMNPSPSLPSKVMVNVWAWSVVLLPLWWLGSWAFRDRTPPPPPIDSLSDLQPIFDKDGRQIYP